MSKDTLWSVWGRRQKYMVELKTIYYLFIALNGQY